LDLSGALFLIPKFGKLVNYLALSVIFLSYYAYLFYFKF